MKYNLKVKESKVWSRLGPGKEYKPINLIYKNENLIATDKKGDWYKHDKGWSLSNDNKYTLFAVQPIKSPNNQPHAEKVKKTEDEIKKEEKEYKELMDQRGEIDQSYSPYLNESNNTGNLFIKNAIGIHGLPYQYMNNIDRKLPGSIYGRKYAEKIITRMPLLLLSPGRPKFMKGYSSKDKKNLLKGLLNDAEGIAEKLINEKDGKLYTFEYNYKDYYKYVNSMCQKISRYLGIENQYIYGQRLKTFKWDAFSNGSFRNFVSSKESIAFYVDSETQISESFSNSISESVLSNKVNEASELGQEIQYLLGGFGGAVGKKFDKLKAENYDKTLEEFEKFSNKYKKLLPENLLNTISGGLLTVISGGKMIFPEIWKDSEYSRSYDISIKLKTPDCDNLSWYLNIAVPLVHLISFVAPQQMGHNGYRSPFLVRGYYKGFFNCDMGIITNMSINRGDKARWTLNGLPTEIDINFSIKDLYHTMMVSLLDSSILEAFSNTSMMDYLANLCGININKPDIRRTFDLFYMNIQNKITDIISFNRFLGVQQSLSNLLNALYRK